MKTPKLNLCPSDYHLRLLRDNRPAMSCRGGDIRRCQSGFRRKLRQLLRVMPQQVEGDRDFEVGCMRRGIAALCIEQRSFGERRELKQKKVAPTGCLHAAMHSLLLGKTLLGERVYDVDRGVDYLEQRGDADLQRLGVMGKKFYRAAGATSNCHLVVGPEGHRFYEDVAWAPMLREIQRPGTGRKDRRPSASRACQKPRFD